MCMYIFCFFVGRYNVCEFIVYCLYRKYKEVEGEFFWFINLLGFIRVGELFVGVVLYGECLFYKLCVCLYWSK